MSMLVILILETVLVLYQCQRVHPICEG
jgi:hypothetical protein